MYLAAIKPSKVAFSSAVLPGLGQFINRDYWKVPVVYVALGTSIYFVKINNDKYHKYRDAFKLLKMGQPNAYPDVSSEILQRAQAYHKKNRDLMILVTSALYVLQIVEASVDAHLHYHNVDQDLSWSPYVLPSMVGDDKVVGISLKYTF